MKNRRAYTMMAIAIVLGLAAVALASRWLLRQAPSTAAHVVVATADVNLGQRLGPETVKLAEWPADSLPAGALTDPLKLSGRVLKTSVLRGEPLTEAKLAPAGTLGGLSALITEGKRAITVRVNDVVGVAGFALPGNFVDILVSTQADTSTAEDREAISKIVLERILVLAVAQEVGRDDTKPRVVNAVTLEVSPEQAEMLDLARSVGNLSLVLRNQIDPQPGTTAGATKSSLLGLASPKAVEAAIAAPARRAPVRQASAAPYRHCIGAIDGLRSRKECL
ncbi:Flp pilus assembly protein CpaB [Pseudoduganella albidiflava]|uniref:Flp pilus assembly protein CpaB n=1 Tax=Pseudoduganella albidiflava TaxID=321983 RepID=A0A411X570_9BURK|nr:Flp pilus assembly protein CpaB [Pseudoduganella albidiflava]QBI04166.1 Flp pilus assembly protein CpaB [Pseudoduganella albidiflava]GGY25177.1 pilus assembly-related, exported protein [Pseudoduganella albidiflava]